MFGICDVLQYMAMASGGVGAASRVVAPRAGQRKVRGTVRRRKCWESVGKKRLGKRKPRTPSRPLVHDQLCCRHRKRVIVGRGKWCGGWQRTRNTGHMLTYTHSSMKHPYPATRHTQVWHSSPNIDVHRGTARVWNSAGEEPPDWSVCKCDCGVRWGEFVLCFAGGRSAATKVGVRVSLRLDV